MWELNNDIKKIKSNADIFDPKFPNSFCYSIIERAQLEQILEQRELRKKGGKKGFFTDIILDGLYIKIQHSDIIVVAFLKFQSIL